MATAKVVVSEAERKMVVEGLATLAQVHARAAKAAKNPAVSELLTKDAAAATTLAAKLSTGELEF